MLEGFTKRLVDYFTNTCEIVETQRGHIKVNGIPFHGRGAGKRVLESIFSDKKRLEKVDPELLYKSDKELTDLFQLHIAEVSDELSLNVARKRADDFLKDSDVSTNVDEIMKAIPVIDVEDDKGRAILLNPDTLRPINISEQSWSRIVGKKHVEMMFNVVRAGRFIYNPRTTDAKIDTGEGTFFNMYVPPRYRVNRDPEAKLDERYIKFLKTFFEPTCFNYAINWIYYSLTHKLEDYLVLVGAGGTGKNLLADSLKQLHGVNNFSKAPNSCLNKEFNGHLLNSTLVFYDECKFSSSSPKGTAAKNRLKEWANKLLPIETKGKDSRNVEVYCSGIIATNNDSDVHIEQLDRKFSVMEITQERLIDRLGEDTTHWLWEYIKTEEFKQGCYNYLEENHDPEWNVYKEYRGSRMEELIQSSLLNWQRVLIFDVLKSGRKKHYFIKDLQEEIPMLPAGAKISDALYAYTDNGVPFGELIYYEGKKCIRVPDKYAPKEESGGDL